MKELVIALNFPNHAKYSILMDILNSCGEVVIHALSYKSNRHHIYYSSNIVSMYPL